MKYMRNLTLTIAVCAFVGSAFAALTTTPVTTNKTFGHNFFSHRSQGWNLARNLVGVTQFIAPCDIDCLNGFFSITPAFSRNFDRDETGRFFFFNGSNTMTFGAAGGEGVDVFVRNLFLNDIVDGNFRGTGTILPRVDNFIAELRFRLNLDEWICGLYFDIFLPINWTRWDLNLTENRESAGTNIAANDFGNMAATPSPVTTLLQAFNGQQLDTANFPDLKQELRFGRINGSQSKAGVADITAAIGYNFICNECAHVGVDIRALFPTGTRPDAEFLFEPIVGGGKHFGLGGDINASYEFWNNCCDSSFSVWIEGYVLHLFKARQRRLFDLNNPGTTTQNVGSNRLLIKRFTGAPTTPLLAEILFGPNVLARELKVRNDAMGEAVLLFDYQRCGFTLDFGYNFWFRTEDKISNIEPIDPDTFGLVGKTTGSTGVSKDQTGSTAKINGTGGDPDAVNRYITTADLSINSVAHPNATSHKVFIHAQYAWDSCDYTPFLGAGGSVEFSGRRNNAFDQWEVWLKGGFAFM